MRPLMARKGSVEMIHLSLQELCRVVDINKWSLEQFSEARYHESRDALPFGIRTMNA